LQNPYKNTINNLEIKISWTLYTKQAHLWKKHI